MNFPDTRRDPRGASPFAHLLCFPCIPWNCSLWVSAVFIKKLHTMLTINQAYIWAQVSPHKGLQLLKIFFFSLLLNHCICSTFQAGVCYGLPVLSSCSEWLHQTVPVFLDLLHFSTFCKHFRRKKKKKKQSKGTVETLGLLGSSRPMAPPCDCLCPP